MKVVQILTNVFLSEQEADLLTSNHAENFPRHLKIFKEHGLERAILAKDLKDDGSHRIYTIAIFSDQESYEKCIPLLKKYAELVEPSKSELPQKMISSVSKVLHDTDKTLATRITLSDETTIGFPSLHASLDAVHTCPNLM